MKKIYKNEKILGRVVYVFYNKRRKIARGNCRKKI